MPVYKAEAIVIRRANLGEADRLITLFCRDQGKVVAVAKGARKIQSRFAGRLELFSHVRALLAVGRTLDVVLQVEVVGAFGALRTDLDRLSYAAFAAELVDRATAEREPSLETFTTLRAALSLMEHTDPELVVLWFGLRLLGYSGYAPAMGRCQVCGRPVDGGAPFSDALGGVLCEADHHRDPDAVSASAGVLRAVGYLQQVDPAALGRLVLNRRLRAEAVGLLQRYAEYRFETKLKAPGVIQKLSRPGRTIAKSR